jgi:hypothetical protein
MPQTASIFPNASTGVPSVLARRAKGNVEEATYGRVHETISVMSQKKHCNEKTNQLHVQMKHLFALSGCALLLYALVRCFCGEWQNEQRIEYELSRPALVHAELLGLTAASAYVLSLCVHAEQLVFELERKIDAWIIYLQRKTIVQLIM